MQVVRTQDKRLNEMDRLQDMLHFPAVVNAGATANVLLTIAVTWLVAPHYAALPGVWVGLVLLLNLAPVVLLRLSDKRTTYPTIAGMDFFKDQHRFSNWVYLAASANMTIWILIAWTLSLTAHQTGVLIGLELVAFVLTFSPVLVRRLLEKETR